MENNITTTGEMRKHLKVLEEKMEKFLSPEKSADILILKTHLICEYYINQILILRHICTAHETNKLGFHEKVSRALDCKNLNEKNINDRLLGLNKLRNKVGHELEYNLSESDVDNIGYIIGKEYILRKYDFDKKEELLRATLLDIVIDISFIVYKIVEKEKSNLVEDTNKNK